MVGMSRESINKQLGQWRDEGIVAIEDGRITITDLDALRTSDPPAGPEPRSRAGPMLSDRRLPLIVKCMIVRRIGLALLILLALPALLIAGVLGLAQTGFGKRMIAEQLGGLLSTPEMTIEISGLQGIVPIDMRIGRVTAADPAGVWLRSTTRASPGRRARCCAAAS